MLRSASLAQGDLVPGRLTPLTSSGSLGIDDPMDDLSALNEVTPVFEKQDRSGPGTMKSCRVVLSPNDGVWLIEAIGLENVRSFGRTVPAAIANVHEAVRAAVDDSEGLELIIGCSRSFG